MSTTPNVGLPPSGWGIFSAALSRVFNAVCDAGSCLYSALRSRVVSAWNTVRDFVIKHPRCTYALVALVILVLGILLAQPLAKGVVRILGFGASGVRAGSIAAQIQGIFYGGFVPAGSIFSALQSFGALL